MLEKLNNLTDNLYPLKITLNKSKKKINVLFNNGKSFLISAELLRVESPSAEVQGHGGTKKIVKNKHNITIDDIKLVGNYAVRIVFSDGHKSGLYTWGKLLEFGEDESIMLANYYKNLIK